ncbi:hypothetical protein AK812_SmicGene36672 [Symbiodinium microadriaticum]|uniref:Uncharacterized protein n=1 Tax=Symbiodinium microadriaticum TaxID=2951 RepID=A0A1Q9CIA4_SYMMI|nr:hypothetical protein AK812_SmicGene36672 [Symbiodinium microadriaticum]
MTSKWPRGVFRVQWCYAGGNCDSMLGRAVASGGKLLFSKELPVQLPVTHSLLLLKGMAWAQAFTERLQHTEAAEESKNRAGEEEAGKGCEVLTQHPVETQSDCRQQFYMPA